MMEGHGQRLQKGDGARGRRRHPATAKGFLPTLPATPDHQQQQRTKTTHNLGETST
jgi:hypothetical protein